MNKGKIIYLSRSYLCNKKKQCKTYMHRDKTYLS